MLEFWEMCVGLGKPIEIDMAAEALRKLDVNCDGVVDIDEFSTWWIPFEARLLERMRQQQEAAAGTLSLSHHLYSSLFSFNNLCVHLGTLLTIW